MFRVILFLLVLSVISKHSTPVTWASTWSSVKKIVFCGAAAVFVVFSSLFLGLL